MLANSGYVMTLANSIIGVGILAMPFCFQKCGIILAILLLILSNWITRVCCHYLIKTSLLTRRKSFEFLGFHAFGTSGKLLVELCIIGYLLGSCITYFVVVGDLGPQIVTKMFSLENEHRHLRTLLMCGVTLFCIIPLGMLKNVDSLSTVCTASIGFYVCLVIKIILESETHIMANDWSEKVLYWEPAGVLQCLPIFSMALSCQMQIFEVFSSINNQSLDKLNAIVRNATWICTLVYIAVGFFGYVAFCTQIFSGNILMNLSASFGSDAIKIGFVLSVAFSFPLVIFPCRASLYSLLYRKGQTDASGYIPENRFRAITVFIVIFSLCIALMIPSVELVIGLVGSTIGVAICIMFPAACFRRIIKKDSTERNLAQFIVVGGFCLMILGTYANLSAIDEKSSGSHLDVPKVDESLLKPTEFAKESIDEKIKNIEKALEEKDKEKDELNKIVKSLKDIEMKEIINKTKIILNEKPSPPPLPVDEEHPDVETNEIKEEIVIKSLPEIKQTDILSQQKSKENDLENKISNNATDVKISPNKPSEKEKEVVKTKSTESVLEVQPQTIDNDAIKKDEEVAKEEYKQENDELKKTQKELEKTKDLLEKKVEELKEELVKQNQETQNLVVEKLGEVVEKFEAIERKVQKQNEDLPLVKIDINKENNLNKTKDSPQKDDNDTNNDKPNKGSLISILTENRTLNNKPPVKQQVYEPLSYKTGELLERVNNGSILEKRLPLPLALLINASQAKMNETLFAKPLIPLQQTANSKSKAQFEILTSPNTTQQKDFEKLNVEAIRRDILQLKSNQEVTTTPATNEGDNLSAHRNKRSYQSLEAHENCLTEPKLENLMAAGHSPGLEMKIGRDLKAIKDEG